MKYLAILIPFALLLGLNGCYYDNEEDLYPVLPDCDTIDVSYSITIVPLLEQHCLGCHSNSARSGNIGLEDHAEVQTAAQNGSFYGSISRSGNFSPMPKGGNMLPDCDIAQVKHWIWAGALNN